MRYVTPLLTLALVAGLFVGVTIDARLTFAVTLAVSAAWAALLLSRLRSCHIAQLIAAGALVACVGWMLGRLAVDHALNAPLRVLLEQRLGGFAFESQERRSEEPILLEGRLLADAAPTQDGAVLRIGVTRVWIQQAAERTVGGVSVGVSGELATQLIGDWRAGRTIRAPVLLRRPARYFNHGLPDQERQLARRGIALVGTIKSATLVDVVAPGSWWEEAAAGVRARTRAAIARHVTTPQAAAVATAILIGDRAGLSADTERRLQEAGTYHVIAISGGNIAILAGLLLSVLHVLRVAGRGAALLAIAALAAYGIIAAGGASVLRATSMAVVYLAVRLIDQRTPAANALAISAGAILLVDPLQIVDVGFWFTFGATVALVTAAALVRQAPAVPGIDITTGIGADLSHIPQYTTNRPIRTMRTSERIGRSEPNGPIQTLGTVGTFKQRLRTIAAASLAPRRLGARASIALLFVIIGTACVELALAPIAAYVFQRVTVAGLVLNFAALPAMTLVQLAAMGVVAFDAFACDRIAGVAGQVVIIGATVLVESARLLDYAPWLTWRVPSPETIALGLYYAALIASLIIWRFVVVAPRALRVALVTCAGASFLWIVAAPAARVRAHGDGYLHVTMLDVGQGDSVLVTFPNGRQLLVDTGGVPRGTFDIGERVIGPSLRARQLLALDVIAVTHADGDHLGGAASLVRDFSPSEVWWSIPVAGHEPTLAVRAASERQRAAWRTVQRGDETDIGGVTVRAHHPPPPEWERQRVRNDDSQVLELRYREVSVLLTGDIGHEVEAELAATLDLRPLVVLKVAHHGSISSSTHAFLNRVRPSVALIGVGRGNTYGHPSPYVLGRLQDAGAEIFRTDLDGQIRVTTDGHAVWTSTFTGRTHRVAPRAVQRHHHDADDEHEDHQD